MKFPMQIFIPFPLKICISAELLPMNHFSEYLIFGFLINANQKKSCKNNGRKEKRNAINGSGKFVLEFDWPCVFPI